MISVIIPVYNVEKYLEKCVMSVLRQTYKDFQCILVNDGSTDDSGIIADGLAVKDDRILVVHQENMGLSGARNIGLSKAEGTYITYIDSDDYVAPTYLETLYNMITMTGSQVAVGGYCLDWPDQKKMTPNPNASILNHKRQTYTGQEAAAQIVRDSKRNMITAWGKLYHKDLKLHLVFPRGKTHEDEFVTYKVLYCASQVVVTSEPLYYYVQRGDSIMNRGYNEKRLDKLLALREAVAFFHRKEDSVLERYAQKRYVLNLQIAWYRVKKIMPNRKDLHRQIRAQWWVYYKAYRKNIKLILTLTDRLAIGIFLVCPPVYSMFAGAYLKLYMDA